MSRTEVVRIERTSDMHDCETCGVSYADGAKLYIDDFLYVTLIPVAHCYAGKHWTEEDIMREVIQLLGYTGGYDE